MQYTFHVSWVHCTSCKILIEHTLNDLPGIKNACVDVKKQTVSLETIYLGDITTSVNEKLEPYGYTLSTEKMAHSQEGEKHDILWKAIPIGLAFLALFLILQKSGILNLGIGGTTTPITSFIIGFIASLSSCLAVVGWLVLSLSAKIVQDDKRNKKPFILFHTWRLLGFSLLGGILGLIGQSLSIGHVFSAVLGLIASFVMIVLWLNLVGVFRKSKFTLPSSIFSFFKKIEHGVFTPILIVLGTFFLPCGFTQSMQVVALSSGSFWSGMLIMLSFALGTLPMLTLLSFGSASFARSKNAPLFFKSAGVVVIGLGIFAFLAGLAGLGIIPPLFSI